MKEKLSKKLKEIKKIRDHYGEKLRKIPGVTGIGIGFKVKEGTVTKILCLRVYVEKKKSPEILKAHELIPRRLFLPEDRLVEAQLDVIESGEFKAQG